MRSWLMAFVAISLASCANPAQRLPTYQHPVGDPADFASISGTRIPTKFFLYDDFHTYVQAVDGHEVPANKKNREQAIQLVPGSRSIVARFERGAYHADATIEFVATAGNQYQVKSACPHEPIGQPFSYCDFWVIDSTTRDDVSPVVREKVCCATPMIIIPSGP